MQKDITSAIFGEPVEINCDIDLILARQLCYIDIPHCNYIIVHVHRVNNPPAHSIGCVGAESIKVNFKLPAVMHFQHLGKLKHDWMLMDIGRKIPNPQAIRAYFGWRNKRQRHIGII